MTARMLVMILLGFASVSQAGVDGDLIEQKLNQIQLDKLEGRFDVEQEIAQHEKTFEIVYARMKGNTDQKEESDPRLKVQLMQKRTILK